MNSQLLKDTVKLLFADNKGLLAMDESNGTCNKRFEKLGIPQTVEARRAYRELIVTTPGLAESIGGAILFDETIRQQKSDGIRIKCGAAECQAFPSSSNRKRYNFIGQKQHCTLLDAVGEYSYSVQE
jgi:fructose-bisphosphate aldolase class I